MASRTSFIEEMTAAARGVLAIIRGNRRAPEYFDLSQRGLVGSFIALLLVTGLNAVLPTLLGVRGPAGSVFRSVAMIAILFAFQVGFSAIVLRQIRRLDGLVPYLVADNWATFYITIATSLLAIVGVGGDFALIAIGILVIVVEINIARLIVTLTPLQIAMFLIAQLVGVSIGLILIGVVFPVTPMELQELGLQ
ncbi:MAG TPA: hypothetical protein GYA10_03790 [Alphaproteobacteria bacterium]|nr:hypothetical protein [Alphaproteobacteria bacterium]